MDQVGGPNTWSTLNNHLNGIQNATDSATHTDLEGGGAGLSSAEGGEEEDAPKVIKVPVPKPFDFPPKHQRKPNPHLPIDIPRKMTTSRSRGPAYDPTTDPTPTVRPFRGPPSLPPSTGYEDDLHVVVNFTQFCPPSTARGLFWNWTRSGETAVLQCPSGSTGFAKWRCGADSKWASQAPTFAECRSLWLGDLDARLRDGVPIANVSNSLAYYSGLEPMYGGDIALAAKMLKHMAERMHYEIQRTASLKARESMVTDLIQNVVRAASNVVDRMNRRSWGDLDKDEAGRAATDLMVGLEENAFLLADSVTSETILVKPTDNICEYIVKLVEYRVNSVQGWCLLLTLLFQCCPFVSCNPATRSARGSRPPLRVSTLPRSGPTATPSRSPRGRCSRTARTAPSASSSPPTTNWTNSWARGSPPRR